MGKNIENLEQKFQEMDKRYKEVPKRKWNFRLTTLIFMTISFFMAIVLSIARDNSIDKIVTRYLEATDCETLYTLYDNIATRGNTTALAWYEQNMLGISNNTALAGISWNCEANKSNMNVIGDIVAFCDEESGGLKVNVSGETVYSGQSSVGEIIATKECVYFIDETDGDSLHIYSIDTDQEKKLIDDSVCQFALYGNYIFYLNNADKIIRYSLETAEMNDVVDNVQRFYFADDLIVQNGTDIVCVKLDGSSYTTLLPDALLVGADSERVYYTNFGMPTEDISTEVESESSKIQGIEAISDVLQENSAEQEMEEEYILFAINLSTKEKQPIDERNSFIRAVYVTEEGIFVDTVD